MAEQEDEACGGMIEQVKAILFVDIQDINVMTKANPMGENHDLALRNTETAEMPAEFQRGGFGKTASQIGGGRLKGLFVKKRIEWGDEPDENTAELGAEKSQAEQEEADAESVSTCIAEIFRFFLHVD